MFQLEILGRALRWLREDRGLKQDDVAQAAGITRPMLSAYERGRVQPTLDTLDRLLHALDCDLSALSQALNIVTSMGKVGRHRGNGGEGPEETAGPPQGAGRWQGDNPGPTRAPFALESPATHAPLGAEEADAFQDLLRVHQRWLHTLRQSLIRQREEEAV